MPPWKIDKLNRKLLGPNPFRASDVIGAPAANYLIWSCLHHLSDMYGDLFKPTPELVEHKDTGAPWYPPNHFRPLVDWRLDESEREEFRAWILGSLFQMTSLMVHERRAHLAHINAIGEACAQFRRGMMAVIREVGEESAVRIVEAYHRLHPEAAANAWHPEAFELIGEPEWQQLYVNAEHDGTVGVVTISRESYNRDVDRELNRALDWLKTQGIERVIVTGDFHLSTQMVGADTSEFFPALESTDEGVRIATEWSRTARRLESDFKISVGVVVGKRCLGGFLELLAHCGYVVAVEDSQLGLPEVTLPVVPGMEGCHWILRKARREDWPRVLQLLLGGRPVTAQAAVGWLIDYAAPLEETLRTAWTIATSGDHGLGERKLEEGRITELPEAFADLPPVDSPATEAARRAVMACIRDACACDASEALSVQARHAAEFLASSPCREGRIGAEYTKVMSV